MALIMFWLVMASSMEGLPFAVIEAMCNGVVPVSTAVGTIEDLLVSGENGLLFEQGDWRALAEHICALLEDEAMYLRLRVRALEAREVYSFEAATAVWDAWFRQIDGR
jgi:glycosyltransferase involved in cell wall biosynthesis